MCDNILAFLQLIKLGIGSASRASLPGNIDWSSIETLAARQGLSAVVLDGIERHKSSNVSGVPVPDQKLLLQWIGEVMQNYEQRYVQYKKAVSSLAGFYNHHGYKMMVLKGYACSIDWPKPEHRPCGDIDIWLFGKQEEADKELVSSFRVQDPSFKIDSSHHHHTVFEWEGFSVENHFDFINVYDLKSNAVIEKVFKELGQDDTIWTEIYDEKVYLPNPNLHVLFMLRHMMNHFVAAEINLRQLVDYALFVKEHDDEVDWKWMMSELKRFDMERLFNIFNAICVEELGFEAHLFPSIQYLPSLKQRVVDDILLPKFNGVFPKNIVSRVIYKYKRWKYNSWKRELCFNEDASDAFWSGVWSHIKKPSTI